VGVFSKHSVLYHTYRFIVKVSVSIVALNISL